MSDTMQKTFSGPSAQEAGAECAGNSRLSTQCGGALAIAIQVVLVALVLGQIVFLASRYRARIDLTEQQLFTLTDSTSRILNGLEDRLIIEAYFSPDSKLSAAYADARTALRNLLDEYVQNGRGRVVVQYLDPHSDNDLRERAKRLGIVAFQLSNRGDRTLSSTEVWQGLRLRYGEKKKVIPQVGMNLLPFVYESTLTPAIKGLTVGDKPKIAMISVPVPGISGQPPQDYRKLREAEQIKDRYQILPHSIASGALIPDHFESALLVRPKDLSDRQKFVIDQFLMRGGDLVVFADTDDYPVDPQRAFNRRVVSYDGKDSELKFLDQLESYGVIVQSKVLLDGLADVHEPFMAGPLTRLFYPYWFFAAGQNWADYADKFAVQPDGTVDEALAETYRTNLLPGISESAKSLGSPGFFWPCPVELADPVPEGLTGEVFLRTSPMALLEQPPQSAGPFGRTRDRRQQAVAYQQFRDAIIGRLNSEARRQHGLMVAVSGTFSSFFEGRDIPDSLAMAQAKELRKKAIEAKRAADPLAEPVQDQPEHIGVELPDNSDPESDPDLPPLPVEPVPVLAGTEPGRLVVIGDSDFIRDDMVGGSYSKQGGPYSQRGGVFFLNLLDWLAEDQDLFELRNKDLQPSKLSLIDEQEGGSQVSLRVQNERIQSKESWVRALNVGVPLLLLLGFGLGVFIRRSAAKRAFLEGLR